jgi:hypothetical protein
MIKSNFYENVVNYSNNIKIYEDQHCPKVNAAIKNRSRASV